MFVDLKLQIPEWLAGLLLQGTYVTRGAERKPLSLRATE